MKNRIDFGLNVRCTHDMLFDRRHWRALGGDLDSRPEQKFIRQPLDALRERGAEEEGFDASSG